MCSVYSTPVVREPSTLTLSGVLQREHSIESGHHSNGQHCIISFLREAHGAAVAFPQTALRAVAGESLD